MLIKFVALFAFGTEGIRKLYEAFDPVSHGKVWAYVVQRFYSFFP